MTKTLKRKRSGIFRHITLEWAHGCAAFHDGLSAADCPYYSDKIEKRREWLKGWNFAAEQERKKSRLKK